MQDLFGSVRRSLVFRTQGRDDGGGGFGGLVEKIGTSIRKSRIGLFSKPPVRALPSVPKKNDTPLIRWRKGELNGCGAFGRVYMGMNLDSGELLAVKQVIRMYTKWLSLGLEYLHKNEIIHRDIKGANILVDIKECIKLADFGASKKVVELVATGKPPWSQKYQEVVALFHIGTTKSLPPIPQHLSVEAKDFSVEMLTRVKL